MNKEPNKFGNFFIPQNKEGKTLSLLVRWLLNSVALIITAYLLDGIYVSGLGAALVASLVLGIVNAVIRPIFWLLTLPVNIFTLGLFTFILNGIMLKLAASVVGGFSINGIIPAVIGSILLSITSYLFTILIGDKK